MSNMSLSNILWSGVSVTGEVVIVAVLLVVSPIAVPEGADGRLVSLVAIVLVVELLPAIL